MSESLPLSPDVLLRHREFLRGLARGLLADDAGVDDVVQEAYVRALQRPPRSEDALRAWLARVVRNLALNRLRGEGRRARRERDVARGEALPSSAEVADRLDVQRRVVEAVRGLREPYRTVVYLRWYEGLQPREIAERLERPIETVRSQLKRAHALLREDLDERLGGRAAWGAALAPLVRPSAPPALGVSASGSVLSFAQALGALALLAVLGTVAATLVTRERSPDAEPEVARRAATEAGSGLVAGTPGSSRREPAALVVAEEAASAASLAAGAHGAVLGRCVRAGTSEPLPGLSVEIDGGGEGAERVTTDAGGAFAGTRDIAEGDVRLTIRNGPDGALVRRVELHHDPERDLDLALELGPTYRLDLELPEGVALEDLHAWLEDPRAPEQRVETLLRAGALPWVRFARAPRASLMDTGGRSMYALRIGTPDGAWGAVTRVHARGGEYPDVLRMTLRPQARVTFALPFEGSVCRDVELELARDDHPPERRTADVDGTVRFDGLEPARYTLRTVSNAVEPYAQELAIPPGDRTVVDLPLVPRERARLEVRLTSVTGTHVPEGPLTVRCVSEPGEPTALPRFADDRDTWLPHGEYVIKPPMADGLAWDPPSARVRVPGPPVTFECRDDVVRRELVLRVFDERTGERLDGARAVVLVDRYRLGIREAAAFEDALRPRPLVGDEPVARVPDGFPLAWVVEAEGHRSVQGGRGDLRLVDGRLVADVRLPASWRTRLWIGTRDAEGRPRPLPGARLLTSGGKLLGTALGDGEIELELLYDPGRLVVEHAPDGERWRVERWEGYAFGRRRAELNLHRVWMERADR